jgi:hypothetical protein
MDTFLVRFSLGRVVLHLVAMAADGAVRFHVAGIRRELELTVLFKRVAGMRRSNRVEDRGAPVY